ncbi:MAG: serine/threonine protein kinase [Bacteroidales bacterium]
MLDGNDRVELTGTYDSYVLYPTNPKSILKPNGELCATFLGQRVSNKQPVLIKRFHKYLNENPAFANRAEREFEALKFCTSQNPELIIHNDVKYLVRNFVDGVDLRELISGKLRKQANQQQIIKIVIQALKALKRIHDSGYIHCDIKPNNIIIKKINGDIDLDNPQVEIIDFGLIRKPSEPLSSRKEKLPFSLIYSSPEQVLNLWELISPATDIYAMGVTLWQLLTGKTPWESSNPLMRIQIQLVIPLPAHRRIPDDIFKVIEQSTVKTRLPKPPRFYNHRELVEFEKVAVDARFQTAGEMIEAIERVDLSVFQKPKAFWNIFKG